MAGGADNGPDVTRADQDNINAFGVLNTRKNELKAILVGKSGELANLEDASNELLLADDDEKVKYKIGDNFVNLNKELAEEMLEKALAESQAEMDKFTEELATNETRMKVLKAQLYGKFGNSINLEDDREEEA